jgi:hypothetical protein
VDTRTIQVTTALNGYLAFPHVGQVFRLTRDRLHLASGRRETEVVYGLTSLTPQEATPAQLLALTRGHWAIENRSHDVRDMAYDEDRQQIRRRHGLRVMATLRFRRHQFAAPGRRSEHHRGPAPPACRQTGLSAHRRTAFGLLGLRG